MPYITSAERFGFQKGKEEGRQEGEVNVILRQLRRRVGDLAPAVAERIRSLSIRSLEDLGEALLDFTGESDLTRWLNSRDDSPETDGDRDDRKIQ